MTSASGLFSYRRTRLSGLATAGTLDPDYRRYHQSYSQRRCDKEGCSNLLHSPHVRHLSNRSEHESFGHEQVTSASVSSNHNHTETLISENRSIFSRNDRLPESVLLARERLLERLSGPAVSENRRRSSRRSPPNNRTEYTFGNDISFVNADWETAYLPGLSERASPLAYLTTRAESIGRAQEKSTKPPGLTQEALDSLQRQIFSSKNKADCGICLENFMEGDNLLCLPCGHRFHPPCLEPWIRTCGDCPYCRGCVKDVTTKPIKSF